MFDKVKYPITVYCTLYNTPNFIASKSPVQSTPYIDIPSNYNEWVISEQKLGALESTPEKRREKHFKRVNINIKELL